MEIHKKLINLNKEYKYSTGTQIKEKTFSLLIYIYKANRSKNKIIFLDKAIDDIEYIRLSIRLLKDLNVLNESKFASFNILIEDIKIQLDKWYNYENKKI
jgi:hypothetical protein